MSPDDPSKSPLVNWSQLERPEIIQQCQQSLQTNGVTTICNFVTSSGICNLKKEILSCPCNESTQHYTCYQDQGDYQTYPPSAPEHPRNYKIRSSASFVGRKSLQSCTTTHGDDDDCECISLYNDDRILNFLSMVASRTLHRSKDDNGSVYSYRIESHHNPPWHFDESHYTAILYLQSSEGGGEFEFVPWCRKTRSVDDEDGHNVIREVVMKSKNSTTRDTDGAENIIQQIQPEEGMLLFFSGVHTFHRAAKVTGSMARIGLVFTFSEEEDFCNSENVKESNEWDPVDSTKIICGNE